MNHYKAVLIACLTLTVAMARADVLVDDMSGIANKTYAGGYVFDIASDATTWEWPDPGLSWQYFDPQDFGLAEEGQFARVHGTLGGVADYPFIGYGCYLVQSKDTMDLSRAVTHFAFRARGVGNWRFKYKNKLIDSLAIQAGKESDQVAWMVSIALTEQWQWFVLPVEDFSANVGDVNTLFTRDGYTATDPLTSIYKIYWQTDGYTSADQGTEVRIDVDDCYLLGSITELGMSTKEPPAEHCNTINMVAPGACGNSAVRWPIHRGRTRSAAGDRRIYSVNGKLIHRGTDGREAVVPHGVYLVNTPGEPAIRATSVNGDK
jgi:hypothetical protein